MRDFSQEKQLLQFSMGKKWSTQIEWKLSLFRVFASCESKQFISQADFLVKYSINKKISSRCLWEWKSQKIFFFKSSRERERAFYEFTLHFINLNLIFHLFIKFNRVWECRKFLYLKSPWHYPKQQQQYKFENKKIRLTLSIWIK